MTIPENRLYTLRELREHKGFTQRDVAARLRKGLKKPGVADGAARNCP